MSAGVIQHELLHVLGNHANLHLRFERFSAGFFHEQSRPDRDDYVSIQWANIQNGEYSLGYSSLSMAHYPF